MSDMAVFLSTTMKFGLLEEWDKFSNTYPLSSSPVLIQLTNATQKKPNTCVLKKTKMRLGYCTIKYPPHLQSLRSTFLWQS